jgi:tetratricopeptide (TPR) repeat protein
MNEHNHALANYEEALGIYRELALENPRAYKPDVAMTLNNLALLQQAMNEHNHALANYEEALQIRRELAEENPRAYKPDVAMTLVNLGILFFTGIPDREKSVACAFEALQIAREYPDLQQKLSQHKDLAVQLLQANGVDLNSLQGT